MALETSIPTPDYTPTTTSAGNDWFDHGSTSPEELFSDKKQTRTLAPNLTRRSHKKSRDGCLKCKVRKIKCDEKKPECTQCRLKSFACQYPSSTTRREMQVARRPAQMLAASPAAAQFSLKDMSFFHHFLTISFPHLPLGNDDVWLRDVPQFAQEYTYLMHAILALGASHLNRVVPLPEYEKDALTHRGHAIKGLNTCMAKSKHEYGEADAMLATCYALTFQAAYMADGLSDFVVMVRGCALASGKIQEENAQTAFNIAPDRHRDVIQPRLHRLPSVSPEHISRGLAALDEMQVYLEYEAEHRFYLALREVFCCLQQSPAAGYLTFTDLYRIWYELDNDAFRVFLDSSNTTIQILFGFFIGVQMMMAPLTAHEWPERAETAGVHSLFGMVDWMDSVASNVPEALQWHLAWSRSLIATAVAELGGLPYTGPPVLYIKRKGSTGDMTAPMPAQAQAVA